MKKVEEKYVKRDSDIRPGDTVKVHLRIVEGGKERIQVFEGVVISVKGSGLSKTFTVRKISHGVGVEKILPVNSLMIKKVDIVERGKVRRSKLYYMRNKVGKRSLDVSMDKGFEAIMEDDGEEKKEKGKDKDKPAEDSPKKESVEKKSPKKEEKPKKDEKSDKDKDKKVEPKPKKDKK